MKKYLISSLMTLFVPMSLMAQEAPTPAEGPDVGFYQLMCSSVGDMTPELQQEFVSSAQLQQFRQQLQAFLATPVQVLAEAEQGYLELDQQVIDFAIQQMGPALGEQVLALLASEEGANLTPEQAQEIVLAPVVQNIKVENQLPLSAGEVMVGTVQSSCGFAVEFEALMTADGCKDLSGAALDLQASQALCASVAPKLATLDTVNQSITLIQEEAQAQIDAIIEQADAAIAPLAEQGEEAFTELADELSAVAKGDEEGEPVDLALQ